MFKHLITLLMFAVMATAGAGEMTLLEEAAEFDRLSARVTSEGKGYLQLKRCDDCKPVRLKVQPGTELTLNGKRRPLAELNNGELRFGTAFYDPETNRVLRISGSR